jgi:uncharacterized protein (TIGR02145 family)
MKNGVVAGKFNVNNQVDSVIFYKPISSSSTTVTDFDGNVYNTITIGSQVWMAENLKTTHYSDGTAIPLVTGNSNWDTLTATSKAYCWYNDDVINKATYGALYTWAAAMNGAASVTTNPSGVQGVCPTGWHLPSDAEWTQLTDYLGGTGVAGGKLKESGQTPVLPTKPVSQPFRVATVTAMVHSTLLGTTVSGGFLKSSIHTVPTTGTCTTIPAM